jgi:DNA end-binding protein Ku
MARSIWKGYLRLSLVNSAVALYPAVTEVNKIHFHKLNKKTGHRLRMRMVDEETEEEVPRDQQIKGYEISKGDTVEIDDDDLDKIALEGTRVIEITSFVPRDEIDALYFDRPYFLAPEDNASSEAFVVMREAMRRKKIGALATVVMHDREHILLIEPRDEGMLATMLRWPYEVRKPKEIFAGIPKKKGQCRTAGSGRNVDRTQDGQVQAGRIQRSLRRSLADAAQSEEIGPQAEGRPEAAEGHQAEPRARCPEEKPGGEQRDFASTPGPRRAFATPAGASPPQRYGCEKTRLRARAGV